MNTQTCTDTNNGQTFDSMRLYNEAKLMLGKSLVPASVDPEYGCAASVNQLHKLAFGVEIGGGASTALLLKALIASPFFTEVKSPLAGDIIISATGTSYQHPPSIQNGHVGVVGFYGICSNNSDTGLWSEVYTMMSWTNRYFNIGGYPQRYFRRK